MRDSLHRSPNCSIADFELALYESVRLGDIIERDNLLDKPHLMSFEHWEEYKLRIAYNINGVHYESIIDYKSFNL